MRHVRPLEAGDIVDIKTACVSQLRRAMPFSGNPQFMIADIAPRTAYVYGRVLLLKKPGDGAEKGVWLWTKQIKRVAQKNINDQWKAFKAGAASGAEVRKTA